MPRKWPRAGRRRGTGLFVPILRRAISLWGPGASASSHRSYPRDADDASLDGRIDVVDAEGFVYDAEFDGFRGHAENHAGFFVLREDQAARAFDGLATDGAVVTHAGKNCGDGHGAGVGCDAFHGDVDVGQIAVDAAGIAVELQATRRGDAQMLTARANVEDAGEQRLVGLGFFDANAGEFR